MVTLFPLEGGGWQKIPNIRAAVGELQNVLGIRVRIVEKSDQRGRIEIEYYSQEDLHRVYELILDNARST